VPESDLIISGNEWTEHGEKEGIRSHTSDCGTVLSVEIGIDLLVWG